MPFLPEGVERSILQNQREKKRGEEGILHQIELDNKSYFAKQWRGKHYEGSEEISRDSYFMYDENKDRSPVSPFWFKVKYYEYALINEMFPENTVKILAGYDPRIVQSNDSKTYNFKYNKGLPVTLTREVGGRSRAREERDKIVDSAYKNYFQLLRTDDKGRMIETNSLECALIFGEADYAMRSRFGEDLTSFSFDWYRPKESLEYLAKEARSINPNSVMVKFFESGVLPIHPEFNFIPTGESNEKGPQGVFIEAVIIDIEMFRSKLLEKDNSPENVERVDKKIDRYLLYRILDEIYDLVLIQQNAEPEESLRNDMEVVNEVFQILNKLGERVIKQGLSNSDELIRVVRSDLYYAFKNNSEKDDLIKVLKRIESKM